MISVALVGIGGYGAGYTALMLEKGHEHDARIVAAIDPAAEKAAHWSEVKKRGIPVFNSLEQFLPSGKADLAVLSTPLHLHAKGAVQCLNAGLHVLCEKPLCATLEEAHAMLAARDKAKRHVAIGYQWSYSDPVLQLKQDIQSGLLGKPKRLRTIALWERKRSYYTRNSWAGAKLAADSSPVFDSPANNATAHYLHNGFFVLNDRPVDAVAELYRANPITNFDTGVARFHTKGGAEILYYCSHAVKGITGPRFVYEFERGVVTYNSDNYQRTDPIRARFPDGTEKIYGTPEGDASRKLWESIEAARGGPPPACSIESAMGQTAAIVGMDRSCPEIAEFPKDLVRVDKDENDSLIHVEGLEAALIAAYEQGRLPSEMGVGWARAGKAIELRDQEPA
jgi:predicted dehydrogenase